MKTAKWLLALVTISLLSATSRAEGEALGDLAFQSDIRDVANYSQNVSNLLEQSNRIIYALVQGSNVVMVVTNYDSEVASPALSIAYLDGTNGYRTVWTETRRIEEAIEAYDEIASSNLNAAVQTLNDTKADKAWSHHTSALGLDAPSNTTWISTPYTVIAGGYEYQKNITSNGEVWILTSNGMDLGFAQGATNSFLNIAAADGSPIFSIEKSSSYLVGVNASGIEIVGATCVVPIPVVADIHPYARVCTNLTNAVWFKEDETGMPSGSPATVTWSGSPGAYVATVAFAPGNERGFCYFEAMQDGETKIVNHAVTDLSRGVTHNGVKYYPTVSGNELKFIAQ